jgi:hypothetical protein
MIMGHAAIASGGNFVNFAPAQIEDNMYVCDNSQYSGNGVLHGSLIVDSNLMSQANADANAASQAAAALAPSQVFGNINNPTTVTGNGGLNVININGNVLNSLILSGTATDVFVVNITGRVNLPSNGVLDAAGGVTANHVLYNVIGNGGTIATTAGNSIEGTLLVPQRALHIDGAFTGEIIGGGGTIKLTTSCINSAPFALPSGPQIVSTLVNDGAVQRCLVTNITMTFNQAVTFSSSANAAFTLVRDSDNATVNFTATVSIVSGNTVVRLSNFTGTATEFGSLADGRYTLTALSSQISTGGFALDGDSDGKAGGNYTFGSTQGLFRLFGDINGDQVVNGLDLAAFNDAFGTQVGDANYLNAFDFNGNGVINGFDLGQFRIRFGTILP